MKRLSPKKRYSVGILLTLLLGPIGSFYAGWRFGMIVNMIWGGGHAILIIVGIDSQLIAAWLNLAWLVLFWLLSIAGTIIEIYEYNRVRGSVK